MKIIAHVTREPANSPGAEAGRDWTTHDVHLRRILPGVFSLDFRVPSGKGESAYSVVVGLHEVLKALAEVDSEEIVSILYDALGVAVGMKQLRPKPGCALA